MVQCKSFRVMLRPQVFFIYEEPAYIQMGKLNSKTCCLTGFLNHVVYQDSGRGERFDRGPRDSIVIQNYSKHNSEMFLRNFKNPTEICMADFEVTPYTRVTVVMWAPEHLSSSVQWAKNTGCPGLTLNISMQCGPQFATSTVSKAVQVIELSDSLNSLWCLTPKSDQIMAYFTNVVNNWWYLVHT